MYGGDNTDTEDTKRDQDDMKPCESGLVPGANSWYLAGVRSMIVRAWLR